MKQDKFDIIIIGGGLSGLTLAMQIKKRNAALSILVLEKRSNQAANATHKVGESIVELGAHYLRNDIGLKDYLKENQLSKFGFRFFLDFDSKDEIQSRIEIGSVTRKQAPSHHIDRGVFENDLVSLLIKIGVKVVLGATVKNVIISPENNEVEYSFQGKTFNKKSRWVVDSSGRRSILKRKLNLHKELNHNINSVWFRIKQPVDIQDWTNNEEWCGQLPPSFRRLSTNHFLGAGYWLWIIPVVNGYSSIGIVADPNIHKFDTINNIDSALEWMSIHEPLVAKNIMPYQDRIADFKVMKHYAHDCKQFFSKDRWAITGEAGVFLDPFYSPGTDFIALSNTWITDLICRDFNNEDIDYRTQMYEHVQRQLINGWFSLYKDLYTSFTSSQVMLTKLVWDWSTYWAVLTPLFTNKGFTNLTVMKVYASSESKLGFRFNALNERVQKFLTDWTSFDTTNYKAKYINLFEVEFLYQFHLELQESLDEELLIERISKNIKKLEDIAVELFRKAYNAKYHTDYVGPIDPYKMDLMTSKTSSYNNFKASNLAIKEDLESIWIEPITKRSEKSFNQHLKQVEDIFVTVKNEIDNYSDLEELIVYLESYPSDYTAIAYEGASFAIGLNDLRANMNLTKWREFNQRANTINIYHIGIGLGWAFAALNKNPLDCSVVTSDELLLSLVLSGVGYYHALYKQKKTIDNCEIWKFCDKESQSTYDQGIGRRLWYTGEGDFEKVNTLINKFTKIRKPDLWKGVGLACGYVGGVKDEMLSKFNNIEEEFKSHFSTGYILTTIHNLKSKRVEVESLNNCTLHSSLNKEDIFYLSKCIEDENSKKSINLMLLLIENKKNEIYKSYEK